MALRNGARQLAGQPFQTGIHQSLEVRVTSMAAPVLFFDIAGPDAASLRAFYAEVFRWDSDDGGRFEVRVSSPLQAAVREDPAEMRIYVGVEDVAEALERVTSRGGSVDTPRFEVPGVAVLGLFRDPAGNPMGLVELEGDRPRIP